MVYSTDPSFEYDLGNEASQQSIAPSKQSLRVALDKRNRGGKMVTLVADFRGPEEELKELGKLLKTKCGVGGSVKDGQIIIQGDFRDKILAELLAKGYKARRIG